MTRKRASRIGAFLLALLVLAPTGNVRAADDEEGRRQYRRGEELLKAGEYWEAARAFEAGYTASGRFGFLLNVGNCYRRVGELGKARQNYWRFLEQAPRNHASREEVIEYLRAIQQIEADGVPLDEAAAPPGASSASTLAALDLRQRAAAPSLADRSFPKSRWWVWALVGSAVAGTAAAFVATRGGAEGASCAASLGCARE